MEDQTGSVPEELQISEDKEPWSITFDSVLPVSAQFSGQGVTLAIRGQRFTRGDTVLKEPMRIAATYKIERTPHGVKLLREGEVDVDYLKAKKPYSVQLTSFRGVMKRKFGALFKPEIVREEGLALPGRLAQAGPLQLDTMSSDGGWLVAAWKMPEKARTAQGKSKP
jgi:hypothetical protein